MARLGRSYAAKVIIKRQSVPGDDNPLMSGVSATATAADIGLSIDSNLTLIGVSATAGFGVFTLAGLDANLFLTGVSAAANVGTLSIASDASPALAGVSATAASGSFALAILSPSVGAITLDISILAEGVNRQDRYLPVFTIMRNSDIPTQGAMDNEIVACFGTFY